MNTTTRSLTDPTQITPEELAGWRSWAAGLFEGEGTVGCYNIPTPTLSARVGMTDIEPLEHFMQAIGSGNIRGPYRLDSNRKPLWVWAASGQRVVDLYGVIKPWLCPRRVDQFEAAILAWEGRPQREIISGPDCGRSSRSGYIGHRRKGEPPCAPCREANTVYMRERRLIWANRAKVSISDTRSLPATHTSVGYNHQEADDMSDAA